MQSAIEPTLPGASPSEQPETTPELTPTVHRQIRRVEPYDLPLVAAILMLMALGAVMVYSATIHELTQLQGDGTQRLRTHLVHLGLALTIMVGATFVPYRALRRLTYPAYLGTLGLLVAVIWIGVEAGNARRWIAFPGFHFQPAELAKVVFVFVLAHSITKKAGNIRRFAVAFFPHFLLCALLIFLCLFQPDFGTSVLLVVLMFAMLFVAGMRIAFVAPVLFGACFLGIQAVVSNDMRLGRVLAMLDPWAHRDDRGHQVINSQIAIGSGEVTGQGVGFGGQTITGFLPEGETDFIFSVIAEQLGSIGVLLVGSCVAIIFLRGMRIALRTQDPYGRMLAFGLSLLLGVQGITNILVAVALVPTKGLTLPFVSYGGSSMLLSAFAAGILLAIGRDTEWTIARQAIPEIDAISSTQATPVRERAKKWRSQISQSRFSRLFKRKPKTADVDALLEKQLRSSQDEKK